MAAIARRTWSQLRDEAIAAAGAHSFSGWSGRVEYLMWEAYLDLCLTYHHHELEAVNTPTTPVSGDLQVTLPADVFVVHACTFDFNAVSGAGNGLAQPVMESALNDVVARRGQQKGLWKKYARQNLTLQFDCPLNADLTTGATFKIWYYQVPAAPDFSGSASPATNVLWDNHLIAATVAKACGRAWTWDMASAYTQDLQSFLQQQVAPSLIATPMNAQPEAPRSSRPQGGAQG